MISYYIILYDISSTDGGGASVSASGASPWGDGGWVHHGPDLSQLKALDGREVGSIRGRGRSTDMAGSRGWRQETAGSVRECGMRRSGS